MHVFVRVCAWMDLMYACMRMCVYIYTYICVCVYLHVYIYIYMCGMLVSEKSACVMSSMFGTLVSEASAVFCCL